MPTVDGKQTIAEALKVMGTTLPFTKERRKKLKPEVFDPPPHVAGSDTSLDAAIKIVNAVKGLKNKVRTLLQERGPMTDEDIALALNLNPSTARPRRIELVSDGIVAQVGEGKTRSGRRAVLWGVVTTEEAG